MTLEEKARESFCGNCGQPHFAHLTEYWSRVYGACGAFVLAPYCNWLPYPYRLPTDWELRNGEKFVLADIGGGLYREGEAPPWWKVTL